MEDFDEDYKKAIDAGKSNLKAAELLNNWCYHAEFVRSGGRGLIEAETGLPIGHMGVQCKFSKKNSMFSWLLEDSIYDFYRSNCNDCLKRVAVGFPNIMVFIEPRERAAQTRRNQRQAAEEKRKEERSNRKEERGLLRDQLELEETFVLDLIDDLDQDNIDQRDPRLEQLANLAPETFTRKIVEHLLPAVLHEQYPYTIPLAKALLGTPLPPGEKLAVAVRLVGNHEKSPAAIDAILDNADKLSKDNLHRVLHRFTSMALGPPPGSHFGGRNSIILQSGPIKKLYQKRSDDIRTVVKGLIADANPAKIESAVEIILAVDDDGLLEEHVRNIFVTLMRRRHFLPKERRDSNVLYYLRKAASNCIRRFPVEADRIIQAFLADNDETGKAEAFRAYSSVFSHPYDQELVVADAQRISFRRLLWAAVENPKDRREDATHFFHHSSHDYVLLAIENFDDLIGAAASLSEKFEAVDKESSIALSDELRELAQMEKQTKRTTINNLQSALIKWAAIGARSKERNGVADFLSLYQELPEHQTQMRGNMIAHISGLISGVDSLNWVLSDWYRALMDESPLVRACAVQAWEDVPLHLIQHFPDLFFEALSFSLSDPYVIVHKNAIRSLRRRPVPIDKRDVITPGIWNLIIHYSQQDKTNEFTVECIDALTFYLSSEERIGETGLLLTTILLTLEEGALYHAINRLVYRFAEVPGYSKVALKALQDDYTRSISTDDCASVILRASHLELQGSVDEISSAFEALKPFRLEEFADALLLATALSRAGCNEASGALLRLLLSGIPKEGRYDLWRLEAELVATASEIEHSIKAGEDISGMIESWKHHVTDLEKEYDEQAKHRSFPPSFLFED